MENLRHMEKSVSESSEKYENNNFEVCLKCFFLCALIEHLPPLPKKWRNKGRLVEVSSNLYRNPSPPAKARQRKWVMENILTLTVTEPVFTVLGSVQMPFAYFMRCFTDSLTEHITQQTNRYAPQRTSQLLKWRTFASFAIHQCFLLFPLSRIPGSESHVSHQQLIP